MTYFDSILSYILECMKYKENNGKYRVKVMFL